MRGIPNPTGNKSSNIYDEIPDHADLEREITKETVTKQNILKLSNSIFKDKER